MRFGFIGEAPRLVLGALILSPAVLLALAYNYFSVWLLLVVPLSLFGYFWLLWARSLDDSEKTWVRQRLITMTRLFRSADAETTVG
ncbi:MAG: hypothetical protein JO314_00570 [Acidobacteria bacterium]|nr:hypothetical protein [Acidobacteriota bacterium]